MCEVSLVSYIGLMLSLHQVNIIYYSETKSFKSTPTRLNQKLSVPLEHFCAKVLGNCKKCDPEMFSCTTTWYFQGQHVKLCDFCRDLTALGVRNVLWSIGSSSIQVKFSRFLTCYSAKYTALPVQHTIPQTKHFCCLIFGTRISNLLLKYAKG